MCNYTNTIAVKVERHMQSHVLVLIEPKKAQGFICPLLAKEFDSIKTISKKGKGAFMQCAYCKLTCKELTKLQSHLISKCLPAQKLGTNLNQIIARVQSRFPVL